METELFIHESEIPDSIETGEQYTCQKILFKWLVGLWKPKY